jgi:hypothetical protein
MVMDDGRVVAVEGAGDLPPAPPRPGADGDPAANSRVPVVLEVAAAQLGNVNVVDLRCADDELGELEVDAGKGADALGRRHAATPIARSKSGPSKKASWVSAVGKTGGSRTRLEPTQAAVHEDIPLTKPGDLAVRVKMVV